MAHIVEFEVEGLAGRAEPYARVLNRDVNIFFGLNGSGKTSLLKIFDAALSRNAETLDNVPFTSARVKIYSNDFQQAYTHTLTKPSKTTQEQPLDESTDATRASEPLKTYLHGEVHEPESSLKWDVSPPLPERSGIGWQHTYLPTTRLYSGGAAILPSVALSEERLDELFARTITLLWSRYSAEVLGMVRKAQEQALADILKAVLASGQKGPTSTALDADTAYERIVSFLHRQGSEPLIESPAAFAQEYSANPQLQSVAGHIDSAEKKILEATRSRSELQELVSRMYSGHKSVAFGDAEIAVRSATGDEITLASLSSGEKQLLLLFLAVVIKPLSSVIIDEPEISMHVDWQRRLVGALQRLGPQAQLVMATHSPEIMTGIPDSNIFRL